MICYINQIGGLEKMINIKQDNLMESKPGYKLRVAREMQDMSVEDIAQQLFVNRQRIIDIDNDDFSRMPSLVHTRGYLRSYAKLVGLPEEEIINDFNRTITEDSPLADLELYSKAKEVLIDKRKNRPLVKILFAAVVIIVILGLNNQKGFMQQFQSLKEFIKHLLNILFPSF